MEEIIKDMERFWSEAMHGLKEVIEKGAHEVVDRPAREQRLPLRGEPCSKNKEKPGRCK